MKIMATMPEVKPKATNAGNSQNDANGVSAKEKAGKSPNQTRDKAVPATEDITIGAKALKA
jgi:hypothetical protein